MKVFSSYTQKLGGILILTDDFLNPCKVNPGDYMAVTVSGQDYPLEGEIQGFGTDETGVCFITLKGDVTEEIPVKEIISLSPVGSFQNHG